jgi:hypothetical protein
LQLEIPCVVMHGTSAYEEQENDGEEERPRAAFLQASGAGGGDDGDDNGNTASAPPIDSRNPQNFPTHDIHEDLQILSLSMAEQCGLRPTAPLSGTRSN